MTAPADIDVDVDDIRLLDLEFWGRPEGEREAAFAALRQRRPVSFHAEPDYGIFPAGPGFWALTRHADVVHASRNPQLFISGKGSNIADLPEEVNEFLGSMINMDAPKHTKLRLIVNRGFTPRMVNRIEDSVRDRARRIVDAVAERGSCDFVEDVAAALPLQIIADMLGIPEADERWVFDQTNMVLGGTDPEYGGSIEVAFQAATDLAAYAMELGRDRLANPRDDITTSLMQAEVEGHRLTDSEFGSFFVLLVVAGNETTRNAISHGLLELTRHPDQRAALLDDLTGVMPTAVDEIVRWATPVIHFRRTATEDTVVGGQEIAAGEKVVLFYNSANRDEAAFDEPYRFDVRRSPNEHVGFGAGGPHFCLGAHLARREIGVMLSELFTRLPDIHAVGEPAMLLSGFIHGIKHLQAEFTPGPASVSVPAGG